MEIKTAETIDKMFEYNLWANTIVIQICSQLTDEQLQVQADGVYGTIRPTLEHLVSAEGYYVRHLTGEFPWADEIDWASMSMDDLLKMAQISGKRLLEVASQSDPHSRKERLMDDKPYTYYNWTTILQALYHGIEHRTQIKVLLTKLGVEHPELAGWDFTGENYQ